MSAQTLFALLGLESAATTDEVEAAWSRIVERHDGKLLAIDSEIRHAYETLREPENLKLYADILDACNRDTFLEFPPDTHAVFEAFCRRCGISWFECTRYPNSFRVRYAGQAVPSDTVYDPTRTPHLRMSRRERVGRFFRRFALGEVFQGRSRGERIWIGAGYIIVLLIVAGIARSISGSYSAWRQARAATVAQRSNEEFRNQFDTARARIHDVETLATTVAREFQEVTQISLADAGAPNTKHPRELDLALIRHASVKEAWVRTINERVSQAELETRRQSLQEIAAHLKTGVGQGDAQRMGEIIAWAAQRLDQLNSHRSNIDHIRVMMQADRFEYDSPTTQGSDHP